MEISNVNLSNLKTGKVRAIRFSTLDAICRELHCQPGEYIRICEEEEDEEKKGVNGAETLFTPFSSVVLFPPEQERGIDDYQHGSCIMHQRADHRI